MGVIAVEVEGEVIREMLAVLVHEVWAEWNNYVFEICEKNEQGLLVIPMAEYMRWKEQSHMPYNLLHEGARVSDRVIASRYMRVMTEWLHELAEAEEIFGANDGCH